MREILFRGKRIDSGNWVFGYYLMKSERHIIWDMGNILIHEVSKENIGQFTGLTDKNGVKIFEGDVTGLGEIVVFEDGIFGTTYIDNRQGVSRLTSKRCQHIEIIGNIYDNPELL